ncbi:MAG: hypothetical protein JWO58_3035 [Chitinophagaceae bacterium]|nr:hypothetical protein [Chitinophagaceae bacterium]
MKKYILLLCLFLCYSGVQAQFLVGTPPSVSWMKTDMWPQNALVYSGSSAVPDFQSGSDWWERSAIRYSGGIPVGYVHAGYGSMPGLNTSNFDNVHNPLKQNIQDLGGCGWAIIAGQSSCYSETNLYVGTFAPFIGLSDLSGNHNPSDLKSMPFSGVFYGVTSTSDGGYLAVGTSLMSSSFVTNSSGALTGLVPIVYNPTTLNHTSTLTDGTCTWGGQGKALVIKLNADLSINWSYLYGMQPYTSGSSTPSEDAVAFNVAESASGGYIICGHSDYGGKSDYVMKLDVNGYITWQQTVATSTEGDKFDIRNDFTTHVESGTEYIYAAGTDISNPSNAQFYISKLNASTGATVWSTPIAYIDPSTSGYDNICNIDVATNGDLLVSGLSDRGGASPDKDGQGYGYIGRLSSSSGSLIVGYQESFLTQASDMKYLVCATSDNGCAVTTTVISNSLSSCSTMTDACLGGTSIMNSDAYVAKFDASLTKIWSGRIDANTPTPHGTAADILDCGALGSFDWHFDNTHNYDLKRQECLFDILEGPDGGLLISGKTSVNQDDGYLIKLCPTATTSTITGQTINTTSLVYANTINVDNTTVSSPGDVDLEACQYVYLGVGTSFAAGSIVKAAIDLGICCTASSLEARLSDGSYNNGFDNNVKPDVSAPGLDAAVYPNPNNGSFTLSITTNDNENVVIYIYDHAGQLVWSQHDLKIEGNVNLDAQLRNYKTGIYMLKVSSDNYSVTRKFVIE